MSLEYPATSKPSSVEKIKLPTLAETTEKTFRSLLPGSQNFILHASDNRFKAMMDKIRFNKTRVVADIFSSLRRYYVEQKNPLPEGIGSRENINEEEMLAEQEILEQKHEEILFKTTKEGGIYYYVLKGENYTYKSGLTAGQNKFEEPPVRYPNEEEAEILLKELQNKEAPKPIACFIDGANGDGEFLFLSPIGKFTKVNRANAPIDTELFTIVVKDIQ